MEYSIYRWNKNGFNKYKNNDYKINREYAIANIESNMSYNKIGKSIEYILNNTNKITREVINNKLLNIIYYTNNNYIINDIEYKNIKPYQLNSIWTLFIKKNMIFDINILEKVCNCLQENDIIILSTKYKNRIYPTKLDLQLKNIDLENINYIIKTIKIKSLIELNLLHTYMKGFLLLSNINNCKSSLFEDVTIIEKN